MKTYIRLASSSRSSSVQPPPLNDCDRYERQPYLTRLKHMRPFVVEDSRPFAAPVRPGWRRFFSMARRALSAAVALAVLAGAAAAEPACDILPVGQLLLSADQLQWLIAKRAHRLTTTPETQVLSQLQVLHRGISSAKPATPQPAPAPAPATPPAPNSSVGSPPVTEETAMMPNIRFTAVDGRLVDLASLRGKVVLIDFWATWCGPCMREIPHVAEVYNKYHAQGFEIIGISFDTNKTMLKRVIEDQHMPWPQYFDGKGWQNNFGVKFGIKSIPTMWLIDQQGRLVTKNARKDLADYVAQLLAAGTN